jgi:pre-mRNA-splicing factor 38A
MANRTDVHARNVHGMNPQFLVEEILRMRIWDSLYWKEHCFALNAETLVDKAVALDHYGGAYGGNNLPTDFLCLLLKMLAIQPEREIVLEFLKNEDYRYVRLLAAFYLRLVGAPLDIYQYLEPLLNDYRRVRFRDRATGEFSVQHVDKFIDLLLTEERVCDIILPRIPTRVALEKLKKLKPRVSLLELGLPGGESELIRLVCEV